MYINNNPRLCFVNTILWEDIFEDSSQVLVSGNSSDNETGSFSKKCSGKKQFDFQRVVFNDAA